MNSRTLILSVAASLALPLHAGAQAALPVSTGHGNAPVARAARVAEPVRVDGRLDEEAWQSAPVVSEFRQMDPEEGAPVSERTEVRILYDAEAMYIGARLYDRGAVTGRLGRRDMPLGDSDWLGVVIDSYHDHRTAFVFDVNPAGVQRDAVKTTGTGGQVEMDDNSWDAVWDVSTSVDDEGWTAELRIPFSQLRFSSAVEQVWGIQLERVIGRRGEYAVFSFTPKSERGGIARYGHLEGLREIRPGKRLEVLPYTVARGEYVDRGANPYRTDREHVLSGGVDLKYRVSSDLTLDATFNPDFGQVEVDPAVINLGVYETFFEEKRPFFVEGSEIFAFPSGGGGQLFYTRRIGRTPQLLPPTRAADVPEAANIIGAGKLSGRTAGGWSVGVLEAVTGRQEARYRDATGVDHSMIVEPLTNYFVTRARREMRAGATAVGVIGTAVNRDVGADELLPLRSAAYTGGVDVRHEWANRRWAFRGAVAASHVLGDRTAITLTQRLANHYFQRPDAAHLEVDTLATSLSGISANMAIARQAGQHWRGELSVGTITPGYEVNDLGFNYRTDRRDGQLVVNYVQNQPGRVLRNWSAGTRLRSEFNTAGQLISNWNTVTLQGRTLNFWTGNFQLTYSLRTNDDRSTRGGPLISRPANVQLGGFVRSDARQPIILEAFSSMVRDEFGGWGAEVGPTVGIKTSPRWELRAGPRFYRGRTIAQYVTTVNDPAAVNTFGRRYVFAELEQTELGLETRFNYAFTPKLTLQTYIQPLFSTGDYGDPKALARPASFEFEPFTGSAPNRDFNVRSLRGNAVLRWEWRPGSTMYLAWQQNRQAFDPIGDFAFSRDRRALFAAEPNNILVLKVNYWLNP